MRVGLLINNYANGGAEKVASKLLRYYSESDVNIKSFTLTSDNDYEIEANFSLEYQKWIGLIKTALKLKYSVTNNKIEVLQSHLFKSNYVNAFAKLLGSKHRIVMVHCVSFSSKFRKGSFKYWFHLILGKLLYRYADLHVFKSHGMAKDYQTVFGIENFEVIYNPCDIKESPKSVRRYDQDILKVAVIGRFHPTKRQSDILMAARSLGDKVEFHFFGSGITLEEIKLEAEKDKLNCIFHGKVRNPAEHLDEIDLYLGCSQAEGFPNAIIEAMSMGLPVVHSDCNSGPREILSSEKNLDLEANIEVGEYENCEYGILFRVGDISALTSVFDDIYNNRGILKSYSEKSLIRFHQLKSIDNRVRYLETFYV